MKNLLFVLAVSIVPHVAYAGPIIFTTENLVSLRDEVTDETTTKFILALNDVKVNPVYVYIDSPGGSIMSGNAITNAIRASGKRVVCITNFAASMSFSILQSCTERYILDGAIVMQHEAFFMMSGNITKNRKTMEYIGKLAFKLNKDDAARLGMDILTFMATIHDEWWMVDDEIVKNRAADGKVQVRCSVALSRAREVRVLSSTYGQVTMTWSACPLAVFPISVVYKMYPGVNVNDYNEWIKGLSILDRDWKTRKEVR